MIKTRKPMSEEQTAKHARRVMDQASRYLNRPGTRSDAQAFREIKRTGKVPTLAQQLLENFQQDDAEAQHFGEDVLHAHRQR